MSKVTEAVIFDMDGVIIDSEPLWKRAEYEIFSSLGVNVASEYAEITKYMTTGEVTRFWYEKSPWKNVSLQSVEQKVINYVGRLIETDGAEIRGAKSVLEKIKLCGYKIGLATNSPCSIIPMVFNKLDIAHFFDAISSAENEVKGKPDPSIYLTTAQKLAIQPQQCVVFEDSYSGVLAAKNAGMRVIALTNEKNRAKLGIADVLIDGFENFDLSILN